MEAAAWVCLFSPLAGAVAITLAGTQDLPPHGGLPGDALGRRLFRCRGRHLLQPARPQRGRAHRRLGGLDVARGRGLPHPARRSDRPAQRLHDAGHLRRRRPDRRLLDRLHGRRGRGAPLLRLHGAVRVLDAAARSVGELRDPARRLGARRALLLPADRLPPRSPERGRGGEEGVHHERVRRRDHGAGDLPAVLERRHARPRGLRVRRGHVADGHDPGSARDARRRRREVGAAAAAHLAARRDGGPDAGQRPDPRRDDGDGRRLHARPRCTRSSRRLRRFRTWRPGSAR